VATRTFSVATDTSWDQTAGANYNGQGLNIGASPLTLRIFRSAAKFNLDWTDVTAITSAVLYLRSQNQYDAISPSFTIKRLTAAFSETTQTTTPSNTSTGQVATTIGASPGVWYSVDITAIVRAWAPASVSGGGAQTNHGILFVEGSANVSDTAAFEDREHTYDEYIVLTYTSNAAPTAPSAATPVGGVVVASQQPVIGFVHHDPNGDSTSAYQLQVSDHYPVDGNIYDASPSFVAADGVQINAGGGLLPVLVRGTTYYWRARTKDAGLWGPYCPTQSFKVGVKPVGAVTSPVNASVADLWLTAGADTTPKLRVTWTHTDGDGHGQSSATVKIYADSAGLPGSLLHTQVQNTSALTMDTTYAVTNGTKYHVSVQTTCTLAIQGDESAKKICRVRWGRAAYRADLVSAPTTLSALANTTLNGGSIVIEYGSNSTTTEPTDWKATMGEVAKLRYVWHRVTMWNHGSASPTSPKVNDLTISYSSNVLVADNWTMASQASIDLATFVYGTQSLKHTDNGSAAISKQVVEVTPNTDYVLSARMKNIGSANRIRLVDPVTGDVLATVTATSDTDWVRYSTPVWNSGSATSVEVQAYSSSASGQAWWDAFKLEASLVVTPWSPGFLGQAVTLDAGGIGIDGQVGGVFRLRGSSGGARDVIKLGSHGLQFGGDMDVYSDYVGRLLGHDGTRYKGLTSEGWSPFAFPEGSAGATMTNSSNSALEVVAAGNGGAILVPFRLSSPMLLQSCFVFNTDTASLRTAEWRLYVDRSNGATLDEVAGANGTWSFTPTVASERESAAASAPVLLSAGLYWLVIRNTSTAQTFGVSLDVAALFGPQYTRRYATQPALASTLTATNFTGNNKRAPNVVLRGRVFGEAAGF